jgi:hypothetical protein
VKSVHRLCVSLAALEREWRFVVGDALADRSCPKMFEDGVLVVSVTGQSVMQDIGFKKAAIRRAIRDKISLEIKDIRAEIGRLNRTVPEPPPRRRARPPRRDGTAGRKIDDMCRDIMSRHEGLDPELALRIARCRVIGGQARRRSA